MPSYLTLAGPGRPALGPVTRPTPYAAIHLLLVPVLLGTAAWLTQHSLLDPAIAGLAFDTARHAFSWRDSTTLEILGHHAARGVPVLVAGISIAAGMASIGLAGLRPWRHILLTLGAAIGIGALLIALLKTLTAQHCPLSLLQYGGIVSGEDAALHFWAASQRDAGHCLPSAHAGGGYALVALYFAGWAAGRPLWRWAGLAAGIAFGFAFSAVRIAQGASFASATLWSAWVEWCVCAIAFAPALCRRP